MWLLSISKSRGCGGQRGRERFPLWLVENRIEFDYPFSREDTLEVRQSNLFSRPESSLSPLWNTLPFTWTTTQGRLLRCRLALTGLAFFLIFG
jgi:hypothetical protein